MKRWISFNFDGDENAGTENNFSSPIVINEPKKLAPIKRLLNLEKALQPKTITDLAVHNKKIKDIQTWLEDFVLKDKKDISMLLLIGPTGCGKTTTLNVLCDSLNIDVVEWINPIDKNYDFEMGPGQTARLLEFLTESKYPSLIQNTKYKKKIVLIEDFPNSVIRNTSEFHEILETCSNNGRTPVVFICTDCSSSNLNLSQTLFPQEIREKYNISTISFNASSVTLLKNALKRAQNIMQEKCDCFDPPSTDTIEVIANSALGDIRCAINQLQFACLKGTSLIMEVQKGTKRKRNEKFKSKLKVMSRDEQLGLFHGLGRVLNPKRKEHEGGWRINCDLIPLIDEFSTHPSSINLFLHENYIKYFGNITEIAEAAQELSEAQIFLDLWTEKQEMLIIGLWVCVLGLMINNEHKVSKWNQIRAPTKIKRTNQRDLREFPTTELCYYDLINKTSKYHLFNL